MNLASSVVDSTTNSDSALVMVAGGVAPGTSGSVFLSGKAAANVSFGSSLPDVDCTGYEGGCCFAIKVSSSGTVDWARALLGHNYISLSCYANPVATANGSLVYVASDTFVVEIDGNTGAILRRKNITSSAGNASGGLQITALALLGNDLYFAGEYQNISITVDSVTLTDGTSGAQRHGFIYKLPLGTWTSILGKKISTNVEDVSINTLSLGYTSGVADSLIMALSVGGSQLQLGGSNQKTLKSTAVRGDVSCEKSCDRTDTN